MTFIDNNKSYSATGRVDGGADESVVLSKIAEHVFLNGVGKMAKIDPVFLQVALKDSTNAEKFKCSLILTAPRTVLKLGAGPLALLNVEFLVAYAELTVKDLLIELQVLRRWSIDTKTLLETRRNLLDGTYCADIKSENRPINTGLIGRLMIARLNHVSNESKIQKTSTPETDAQEVAQPPASSLSEK